MNQPWRDRNSLGVRNWQGPALLAAAAMTASTLAVNRKIRQAERQHPPEGQFIEVDGVRLHYIERGEGDTLVLLHGNGVMAEDFEISGLFDLAAEHYHVIAFDRPGYGYSERPDKKDWTPQEQSRLLRSALEILGIEHPIVLGHSWGTLVALAMALEFPAYINGLVLLSGYYYPSLRLDAKLMGTAAVPVVGQLMRYTVSPLAGRMMWSPAIKKMFKPAKVAPRFNSFPMWLTLRPSQLFASAAESGMMVSSAESLFKHYRKLRMPVLIMAGSGDRIADPEHNSVRLHDELPHSVLRLKEGVGHMVHYACPQEIVDEIRSLWPQSEMRPPSKLDAPLTLRSDGASAPP
jgi:pimeloyl-ACP methyl ester carboxylesterase